jgi:hypothetical protein
MMQFSSWRLLAGAAMLGLVGVSVGTALALRAGFPLPLADGDTTAAGKTGAARVLDSASEAAGITVTLRGVVRDETGVVISADVRGQEARGTSVSFGPTLLANAAGTQVPLLRSGRDPADPRSLSLWFPAIDGDQLKLTVGSLQLFTAISPTDIRPSGETASVSGPWQIGLSAPAAVGAPLTVVRDTAGASASQGDVMVTEAIAGETGVIIRGRLTGLTIPEAQAVMIRPALTSRSDGAEVRFSSARSGYGEGSADFDFRFPRLPAGEYHLSFAFSMTPEAARLAGVDSRRAADLAAAKPTTWTVTAP